MDREKMTAAQLDMVDSLTEFEDDQVLYADGFEEAFFGVVMKAGAPPVAGYDQDKCISLLMNRDGMDYEEAWEYFGFNVQGAYMGKHTPSFIDFVDGYRPYEFSQEEIDKYEEAQAELRGE